MIRITVHSPTSVTVTRSPHPLARWLLGRGETVREAQWIQRPPIWSRVGDQLVASPWGFWLYADNREVEPDVEEAIERAVTVHAAQERLKRIERRP